MRSAVCRCLRGACRSSSRIWWMMGRNGPSRGLDRGVRVRKPGGSSCVRILCSVCQWMSYSWHAWRLLISPVRTRRRISAHASMSVYTPASCRTASDHGRDRYRTVGTALERYTFGSANRTSASAALLGRRLHPRPWSSKRWCDYFQRQRQVRLAIPWERGAELTASDRDLIGPSLQVFQQGEAQEGGHFYRCARAYAENSGDLAYAVAHRLFMDEEKRHGSD